MTNIERATRTVWEASRGVGEPLSVIASDHIAAALADATQSLLLPDLPEKEQDGRWKVSCKHLPISHTSTAGDQVTLRTSYGWWHTDWDEARSLGLCLLAAAKYAEENA